MSTQRTKILESAQAELRQKSTKSQLPSRAAKTASMNATDRNAPCPCGSTKKYKHCCQRKEQALSNVNATKVSAWLQLAMQHLRLERLQQAKAIYEQVLQVDPRQPDALQWLGVILHKQGNSDTAVQLIQQAIAERPSNAFFYSTLGNVLKEQGNQEAAIASYQHALSLKQDFAEAHNNLGTLFYARGQLERAIESYEKALSLIPTYVDALNNLGVAFHKKGQSSEAIVVLNKAVTLSPSYGQALFNLATAMHEKTPEQAIPFLRRALIATPDLHDAWITLAKTLHLQGNLSEARACFQRYMSFKPSSGVRIQSDLMIPPIMGNKLDVQESRRAFEQNLDQLMADRIVLVDPILELCGTNFHLAYQGFNDRDIQIKIAKFYEQACPSLLYVAPHCLRPVLPKPKKRVGFLSKFIAKHSVALSFSRIVEGLANSDEFEITLISSSDPTDASIQETYPNFRGEHVRLASDLEVAREEIAALELDVLIYLDIGMDTFGYFLAFARLARSQCVMGGHPVTTGITAMDYFLSCDLAEPEEADIHYSEKLARFPFGMFYFQRPNLPAKFKSREEMGFPVNGAVYICPMVLHKLHPDFDETMERILTLDPSGHIILFEDKKFSAWTRSLKARFEKTVAQAVRSRIVFLPWIQDPLDFASANNAADVVLIPYHFGIGTTAIATCSVGTPFVTIPDEFMRGRMGAFFAQILGIPECVAHHREDYAQKAVAIATNSALRQQIKTKILANNFELFENQAAIRDMGAFLRQV